MPKIAGSHQKLGERHGTDSSSKPPEEISLPTPGFWTSSLQICEEINFGVFLIEVQLLYNIIYVMGVQYSDSKFLKVILHL